MAVPDKLLIEAFKLTLREIRDRKQKLLVPSVSKKQNPNFKELIEASVLPYIDLLIWQVETETKITDEQLATALFPVGEKDAGTIRKTTAKLAREMLDPIHLATLGAQAASKVKERN